jgi:hypothetical protein
VLVFGAMPEVHLPKIGEHAGGKSIGHIVLEVVLISAGVFLGLMGGSGARIGIIANSRNKRLVDSRRKSRPTAPRWFPSRTITPTV